jgi:monofunctional biosynthetic peptidoglycan transglycosylase
MVKRIELRAERRPPSRRRKTARQKAVSFALGRSKGRQRRHRKHQLRQFLASLLLVVVLGPAVIFALFRFLPPPVTPLMIIRIVEGEGWRYDWRPLEEISPHLARSVVAAEDNRFCEHWGIDLEAIWLTLRDWQRGERLRGASTVSMQTTKNLLLWPERNFLRKLLEAWLTPQLELIWSKERIMEVYLNIVEMGPGIYGAEAAARTHFGKSAAQLTRREASILAAVLPNPRKFSAGAPSSYVLKRATTLRRRVSQLGPLLDCLP